MLVRLAPWAVLFASTAAWACPVCANVRDENRIAYIAMTAVMTALPLCLIGGVLGILWYRTRNPNA